MSWMIVCATAGGALQLLDAVYDASVPLSDVVSSACSTASLAHTPPLSVRWPNSRPFIDPHPPVPVTRPCCRSRRFRRPARQIFAYVAGDPQAAEAAGEPGHEPQGGGAGVHEGA